MIRNSFALLLSAMLWLGFTGSVNTEEKKFLASPIIQKKLPNGANVVTVPYDSPGIAAFYIIMRVGSRDEVEEGKSGFAHFFEHVMFRGTEKYSKEKYDEVLKAIGASANANTWLDRTVYHMTGSSKMLDQMFMLEADRFMNLKYSEQDFKVEAGAVKGEYTKNSSDPENQLNEKMNEVAFDKHTYKHTTMGFFKDVVDMPNQYNYSKEFFKRFYRPEYATILVVGDATPETVYALAEKYFGKWERGNYVSPVPVEPTQTQTKYAHLKMDGVPPLINFNFKMPSFNEKTKDMMALSLLSSVLFSEKSPIYNKLVVKEQKLRSLYDDVMFTRDPYLYSINATLVNAADMKYVRDEIMKVLEEAKTKPADAKLLSDVKLRNKNSYAMRMNSATNIAETLSYYIWVSGEPESINTSNAMIEKITAQDLMDVAKKYFVTTGLTYGTLSPDENSPLK